MASQVILKKSSVAARVPAAGDLVYGELALNYQDGLLFYKKADNTIGTISGGSGGGGTVAVAGTTSVYTRTSYTATLGQTIFNASYTIGYVEVYYNGVLLNTSDYTATSTTSIILNNAANLNDIIEIISYPQIIIPAPLLVGIIKQSNTVTVAGSNTYTINYTVGYLDVYINGIKLNTLDFTATNGTTVIIADLLVNDIVELVSTTTSIMSIVGTGLTLASGVLTINSSATAVSNTIVLRDGTGQILTTGIKFSDNSIQTTASVPGVTTGKSIAMAIIFGG